MNAQPSKPWARVKATIAALCLGAGGATALDPAMTKAANRMRHGAPYSDIRHDMLKVGWRAAPSTVNDPANLGRCLKHRWVCERYPETAHCWVEARRAYCSFDLLDPGNNVLHIRARFDRRGTLRVHDHTFFSEGGAG